MFPSTADPMEGVFRKMLALSVALHAASVLAGAAWTGFRAPIVRLPPVTVVDLVGGREFAEREPAPPKEDPREAPPPAAKAAKTAKGKEAAAAKEPAAKPPPGPPPKPAAADAPPDAASLSDRIRRMREEKAAAEKAREAVGTIRHAKAVGAAVRAIRERVAHRVDLSSLPPDSGVILPSTGAAGTARVSPENQAYFLKLDEAVRSRWIVPDAVGDAAGLMVQLRITIEKNGKVSDLELEKTSGNKYFDDSVIRAIHKASPLPVPPEQLRGGEDHYEVGFRFKRSWRAS